METKKRIRYHFLDELRGFLILLVIFAHITFDLAFLFNVQNAEKLFDFFEPSITFFASLFIILCGISTNLSRNNLKRGLYLLGFALIITLISCFIMPEAPIYFGILHLLAISILLYLPLSRLLKKTKLGLGLTLSLFLFFLTYNLPSGYLGFGKLSLPLPQKLYSSILFMPIGFVSDDRIYSDYYPLIPYFFIFLFGVFLGRYVKLRKVPKFFEKRHSAFLSFIGRHTLIIYLLHQPVIYAILYYAVPE